MKKFFLLALLLGSIAYAQVPHAISFQGVARDADGCRANEQLNLSISILDNLTPENVVYSENHRPSTDSTGIFAVQIGRGSTTDDFSTIDWRTPKWVKTSESGTVLGTVEMLTVPFAFQAILAMIADSSEISDMAYFADSSLWADTTHFAANGKTRNVNGNEVLLFRNNSGDQLVFIGESGSPTDNGGELILYGPNGFRNAALTGATNISQNHGKLRLFNNQGDTYIDLAADSSISSGLLRIFDQSGRRVSISSSPDRIGQIRLYGPNGSINNWIEGYDNNNPNHGLIAASDAGSIQKAAILVNPAGDGELRITDGGPNQSIITPYSKHFVIDHPQNPKQEIWYACIEGPEAAAYERGTAILINGEAEIQFSEHFELVINPGTLTITTSPWSADAKGLAVVERTATGFKVKELLGGTGNYQFDWEAKAVRKGHENFAPIRDKRKNSSLTN